MHAKSQNVRGGGASRRLMRGDRSMACDVDSAGGPLWAVKMTKDAALSPWRIFAIDCEAFSINEDIYCNYGEESQSSIVSIPKYSGVIWRWLSCCTRVLLVLTQFSAVLLWCSLSYPALSLFRRWSRLGLPTESTESPCEPHFWRTIEQSVSVASCFPALNGQHPLKAHLGPTLFERPWHA